MLRLLAPLVVALAAGAAMAQVSSGETTAPAPAPSEAAPAPSSPAPSVADSPAPVQVWPTQILTLDQERLFADSAWGKRALADIERASVALAAENREIEKKLSDEEKLLTDERATMAPEAFRAAADAFDARVVGIRNAQDAKARDLTRLRDMERQNFFTAAVPVMGQVMRERGAVAILDARAIFLSVSTIDVTEEMVRRLDAELGAGTPAQLQPEVPQTGDKAQVAPGQPAGTAPGTASGTAPESGAGTTETSPSSGGND